MPLGRPLPLLLLLLLPALALPAWAEDTPAPTKAPAKAPDKAPDKAPAKAPEKAPAKAAPEGEPQADPLLIGTYPASVECVVDADTLRLREARTSVRVLGIDAEELFRNAADREAAAKDFAAYAKAKRGTRAYPAKYGTPAGEAAKAYTQALMQGVTSLRLERDFVGQRAKGTFGRLLAHVFLVKPDGEVNLALELIRSGHTPYFNKYGRSRRFDEAFRKAQAEAREAKRGIWNPDGPAHYPDYPERLAWWSARADQVDRWRAVAEQPNHVTLGTPGADAKLASLVGKEAVVFGTFDRELPVKGGDRRVYLLTHERRRGFPFVIFDRELADSLDWERIGSRYVTLRGKVTLHKDRPQIVVESATQISTR